MKTLNLIKNILTFFIILAILPKRKIIECAIENVNLFSTFGTQQKEANAKERRCNNWVQFLLMGILLMHGR